MLRIEQIMPTQREFAINRVYIPEFANPIWERTWAHGRQDLQFSQTALQDWRTCSGFGLNDPYSLRVTPNQVISKSLGEGCTLAELLFEREIALGEETARGIGEQLCFALHRLHLGVGHAHGALYPYNIQISPEGMATLWSVPTARLEAEYTPRNKRNLVWEFPYVAPELQNGGSSIQGDIYTMGHILQRLLGVHPSPIADVALAARQLNPDDRPRSVREIALVLNPQSQLAKLDLEGGLRAQRMGLEYFRLGSSEAAKKAWLEGTRCDWLSPILWNNLAVLAMTKKNWNEAIEHLERAHKLAPSHPLILCNFAYIYDLQDDQENSRIWLEKTLALKPYHIDSPKVFL